MSGHEYVLDTPIVRAFVASVGAATGAAASSADACEAIRLRFAQLLADPDWLPPCYQQSAPDSGIDQWLLYRSHRPRLHIQVQTVTHSAATPLKPFRKAGVPAVRL